MKKRSKILVPKSFCDDKCPDNRTRYESMLVTSRECVCVCVCVCVRLSFIYVCECACVSVSVSFKYMCKCLYVCVCLSVCVRVCVFYVSRQIKSFFNAGEISLSACV